MPSRKRVHEEIEQDEVKPRQERTLLDRVRNMSEFAALMQYVFFFGKAVKVEEMEVEDFEQECLKPTHSEKLSELGLSLLKWVSSHRGLTLDIWDEYTRRQYTAKAPERNPYGTDEEPKKFAEFDIFTKIRILHQLSIWTLWNADRMREKMPEVAIDEQTNWRIEPYGWDAEERTYFLLDDDRLYRQTDPPIPKPVLKPKKVKAKPKPKPKAKQKPRAKGTRASKRRRTTDVLPESEAEPEDEEQEQEEPEATPGAEEEMGLEYEENYAGRTWECVAVTLGDYNQFLDSIKRSRDIEERSLHKRLTSDVLPILLKKEEERERKALRRLKELENLAKLATAKRSSRLAGKMEAKKEQEEAEEAERKKLAELEMAHKEQERQRKMGEARESRMMTREQRLREREVKRILHEEQLAKEQEQLAALEREGALPNGEKARMSERQLKADMEKRKRELEELVEEDWVFDCAVCGVHGQNWDDGTHSIACEKCGVWQHSACHGIDQAQAEREDFHFICKDCKHKMENPVPPMKLKFGPSPKADQKVKKEKPVRLASPSPAVPAQPAQRPTSMINSTPSAQRIMSGPALSPQGQLPGPPGSNSFNGTQAPHHPQGHPQGQHLVYPGPPPALPSVVSQHYMGASYSPHVPKPPAVGPQILGYAPNGISAPTQPVYPPPPRNYSANTHYNGGGHSPPNTLTPNGSFSAYPPAQQAPAQQANHYGQHRPVSSQSNQGFQYHPPPAAAPLSSPNGYAMSANSSFSGTPRVFSPPNVYETPARASLGPHQIVHQANQSPHYSQAQETALQGSSPGYSPMKQSSPPPRPYSSHSMSERPVVPPVALSPDEKPQIRSPPVKKASPVLAHDFSPNGNGFSRPNGQVSDEARGP